MSSDSTSRLQRGPPSVSRPLQLLAVAVLALIVGATAQNKTQLNEAAATRALGDPTPAGVHVTARARHLRTDGTPTPGVPFATRRPDLDVARSATRA